jgi:hypothetical protein
MKRVSLIFVLGLLAFSLANFVSSAIRSDDENGGAPPDWLPKYRYGFPAVFLEIGGVSPSDEHVTYFSRSVMWADIMTSLVISVGTAGLLGLRRRQCNASTLLI